MKDAKNNFGDRIAIGNGELDIGVAFELPGGGLNTHRIDPPVRALAACTVGAMRPGLISDYGCKAVPRWSRIATRSLRTAPVRACLVERRCAAKPARLADGAV